MATEFIGWRKATRSDNGTGCVEVAFSADGRIGVRDSKLGETGPVLEFTAHEWACFQDGMAKGEFNPPS